MKRILILGGTGWLGREITARHLTAGNHVTCLARGISGTVPEGAPLHAVDRRAPDAYAEVVGRNWDEVIELSYDSELVRGALAVLAPTARHWTLISSVSVYADNSLPDADESAGLVSATDPADYAHAKVMTETATAAALGERLLIVRPGLIVGPADPSDRFGYWVARFAQGGETPVLIPHTEHRHVQVIDVRDLADWIVRAGLNRISGTIDAIGDAHPMSEVLARAAAVAGFTGSMVSASDHWLISHDVNFWAGKRSLPLWLPATATGFARRNNARYHGSGGLIRDIGDTLVATLDDERARGLQRERRSGLTRAQEQELLDLLAEL